VQHVEFFHRHHFDCHYHRRGAKKPLSKFIDFFWETDFDTLFRENPAGFSDALFPNVGYTYLINLGTPFVMQLGQECLEMRSDGFLPRHQCLICHHTPGNRIFGIKFRVSPVIFEKKINASEYKKYIFSLAYLIDRDVVDSIKAAPGLDERVAIASDYYEKIVQHYAGSMKQVDTVTGILSSFPERGNYAVTIEELALEYGVSSRTLQRYFEATTSITSKQALQIMRIRTAIGHMLRDPRKFHFSQYGYYDYSHFYKHLRQFLDGHAVELVQPHLQLLRHEPHL